MSNIPAVDDVPLSVLALDEDQESGSGDDTDVPVAAFQSSV